MFFENGSELYATVISYNTGDGSQPHQLAIDDVTNNGQSDIVVANHSNDNSGVLLGRKNGIFDPIITYTTGNGSAPYSVAVADFNKDTYLDIVAITSETDSTTIVNGYDNGAF